VLEAALALLQRPGGGDLSMRELADALGTAPMSLYRHVRNKDDLMDGLTSLVLGRIGLEAPADGPWRERAAAWMHALRTQLLAYPAVTPMLRMSRHYAPALLRATNGLLRIMLDAGLEGREAVRATREITWATLGFVTTEIRNRPRLAGELPSLLPSALAAEPVRHEVAEIARLMPHFLETDVDEIFAATVRHLLAGLAAEVPARRVRGGGRQAQ
jgi:AcrR family transcriptional regulator